MSVKEIYICRSYIVFAITIIGTRVRTYEQKWSLVGNTSLRFQRTTSPWYLRGCNKKYIPDPLTMRVSLSKQKTYALTLTTTTGRYGHEYAVLRRFFAIAENTRQEMLCILTEPPSNSPLPVILRRIESVIAY